MKNLWQGEQNRQWTRNGLIGSTLAVLVFVGIFAFVFPSVGGAASAISVIPPIVAGLYLGIRGGLLFAVITLLSAILVFLGYGEFDSFLRGGLTGNSLVFVLAIGSGWLSNLLVTVRQQSEALQTEIEERQRAEQARQVSEAQLRTVIDNAPVLLWNVSADKTIQIIQGQALDKFGISEASLVGKPISALYAFLPAMESELESAFKGETRISTINQDDLTFDARFIPIRDTEQEVTGVIGVATDVTEKAQTKVALGVAQGDLAETNQQLQRAHEFFRSTIEVIEETSGRGGDINEINFYIDRSKRNLRN